MGTPNILTIDKPSDAPVEVVGRTIGTAFSLLDPTPWLIPLTAPDRDGVLHRYFALQVAEIMASGTGYLDMVQDGTAVAVWQVVDPANADDDTAPSPAYLRQLEAVCGEWTPRFLALETAFAQHRPRPHHHHLAFLAVLPEHQRCGLGSALLEHRLPDLDRRGASAFLEATTPANVELYRRHGFDTPGFGISPYLGPDNRTTVTPLWWNPRPGRPLS